MNEKITEVFQEIFSSKDLLSKFMLIDDVDELYDFCSSIKEGYSKAEFEDFLMELADECLFQTQLIGSETEKIAGGVNKFKKFISGGTRLRPRIPKAFMTVWYRELSWLSICLASSTVRIL